MADKCPKCGELLATKTIKKELVHGSIEYPVAQICPKCNWSRDLTGAGDIKPPVMETTTKVEEKPQVVVKQHVEKPQAIVSAPPQPKPESVGFNKLLTVILAIIVFGGIIWAFFLYPAAPKEPSSIPLPTPTPQITASTVTPVITGTPAPEVTPTGKSLLVQLNYYRGFTPVTQKIKPGDKIAWENYEVETITLVSSEGLFDAQTVPYGKRTSYVFKNTGTYGFYLKNNKNLTGTITVES